MPWYLTVYLLILVCFEVAALVDDWLSRRPRWLIVCTACRAAVCVICVVAFADPAATRALGLWLPMLIAFAVPIEIWSLVLDVVDVWAEGQSRRALLAIAITVAIISGPAYAMRGMAVLRDAG